MSLLLVQHLRRWLGDIATGQMTLESVVGWTEDTWKCWLNVWLDVPSLPGAPPDSTGLILEGHLKGWLMDITTGQMALGSVADWTEPLRCAFL